MKKIAVGFLTILLCAATSLHAQQIAEVPAFKPEQPTSVVMGTQDTITHTCGWLLQYGITATGYQQFQESYDTLMKFIDSCANSPQSYQAFSKMSADVENLIQSGNYSQDSEAWAQYRTWLYSVLYLNTTDPAYFCACVEQIFGSFGYVVNDTTDSQNFAASNENVAFSRWMLLNTDCDSSQEWVDWQNVRNEQLRMWKQDSIDGVHYPYDTTIPSLSQIGYGLDSLLARHLLYESVTEVPWEGIISSVTANPNPVKEGTTISFGISKEAYVKIELFDVLGKQASSYGYESLFEPGNKSVSFSLAGLPSGTYYARIITAYGEVQTVKLVKE
jgi:hypothetical protein